MAFMDELKKNLADVSNTVAKHSETVLKKSGDMLEIQKAKMKKMSLNNELESLYAAMGKVYFERYAGSEMPEDMAMWCEKIAAAKAAVEEAEAHLQNLKGITICSNCHAEVEQSALYCPKCGEEVVREAVAAEVVEEVAEEVVAEPVEETAEEAVAEPVEEAAAEIEE